MACMDISSNIKKSPCIDLEVMCDQSDAVYCTWGGRDLTMSQHLCAFYAHTLPFSYIFVAHAYFLKEKMLRSIIIMQHVH